MDIIKNEAELKTVLNENKSVFIDFYADWCGPCKMAAPLLEALAADYPEIKFIKVNVDDNPDIAQKYGVMSIPMMVAVKEGKTVGTSLGFKPKEEIEKVVVLAK